MANYDSDEKEAPLDPAAERLRRKLARLLMVSGGFMMLGFIAVFAALVYRLGGSGEAGQPDTQAVVAPPLEVQLAIPQGARLVGTDLDGTRALLNLETPAGPMLMLVEMPSGQILGRYALQPQ